MSRIRLFVITIVCFQTSACAVTHPNSNKQALEVASETMKTSLLPSLFIRPAIDKAPDYLGSVTGKMVVSGPCVFITNEAGRWLVIWPEGTRMEGGSSVALPDGQVVSINQTITLNGGARDGSAITTFWDQPMPVECRGPFFIVNQQHRSKET